MTGLFINLIRRHVLPRCAIRMRKAEAAWNTFWFTPGDPFLLGVLRLLTGAMLVYNLVVWSLDLDAFFSHDGLQPLETIRRLQASRMVFSFWHWLDDAWLWPAHIVCVGVACLFCAGVMTRITSILSFLITISYSHRVPVANFGLDQMLGILCLYLAIGPSGAAVSFDAWWTARRRTARGAVADNRREQLASATMTTRLIQLHWCAIYFWAGHAKLKGETWWTGEAMWNVLANQEYQTADLTWLAFYPWIPWLIAHITVLWETFFPVLIWNRHLRPLLLMIGVGMHLGIGAFLGMWTFGLIMTFGYLAFLDPDFWRTKFTTVARRLRTGAVVIPRTEHAPVMETTTVHPAAKLPVRSSVERTPVLWIVAASTTDQSALLRYFRNRGYDCSAFGTTTDCTARLACETPHFLIIHSGKLAVTDLAAIAERAASLTGTATLLLLPDRLQPVAQAIGETCKVGWVALPASLSEIRQRLEALGGPTASVRSDRSDGSADLRPAESTMLPTISSRTDE